MNIAELRKLMSETQETDWDNGCVYLEMNPKLYKSLPALLAVVEAMERVSLAATYTPHVHEHSTPEETLSDAQGIIQRVAQIANDALAKLEEA